MELIIILHAYIANNVIYFKATCAFYSVYKSTVVVGQAYRGHIGYLTKTHKYTIMLS